MLHLQLKRAAPNVCVCSALTLRLRVHVVDGVREIQRRELVLSLDDGEARGGNAGQTHQSHR